jgi:hypothetical protein
MGLGLLDVLLILVIVGVVFTPARLRELGRNLLLIVHGEHSFNRRERRMLNLALLFVSGMVILCALEFAALITAKQSAIALSVWVIGLLTGWFCLFGGKED